MWKIEDCISYNPYTGVLTWSTRVNNSVSVGQTLGTRHNKGYLFFRLNKKFYFCHKVAWFLHYGCWPSGEIDHINGDKSDNRITNLRDVTHLQNMCNTPSRQKTSSKYKGVHIIKTTGKWRATLWNGCSKLHLGVFSCEKEAALAYDTEARKVFGEYARTNFLDE